MSQSTTATTTTTTQAKQIDCKLTFPVHSTINWSQKKLVKPLTLNQNSCKSYKNLQKMFAQLEEVRFQINWLSFPGLRWPLCFWINLWSLSDSKSIDGAVLNELSFVIPNQWVDLLKVFEGLVWLSWAT